MRDGVLVAGRYADVKERRIPVRSRWLEPFREERPDLQLETLGAPPARQPRPEDDADTVADPHRQLSPPPPAPAAGSRQRRACRPSR